MARGQSQILRPTRTVVAGGSISLFSNLSQKKRVDHQYSECIMLLDIALLVSLTSRFMEDPCPLESLIATLQLAPTFSMS